jgi:hypothetical protein
MSTTKLGRYNLLQLHFYPDSPIYTLRFSSSVGSCNLTLTWRNVTESDPNDRITGSLVDAILDSLVGNVEKRLTRQLEAVTPDR